MNRVLDPLFARVMRRGKLDVIWADGSTSQYGDGSGLSAAIHFKDRGAEWRVAINPLLALGEMYMDDRVEFPGDTLPNFIMLANENWGPFTRLPWVAALFKLRFLARSFTQNNNRFRSRRNVAHHYDLDERLYRLFLDCDMQYSCAYFESPDASLEEAQWAKKRHIAAKLALRPGQQVLDIGCGWGGLGLFLAENTGVDVLGITLSTEQRRVAENRARVAGLDRHAVFELQDYRTLDRSFDRIVSVGMFEHVGARHFRAFFEKAAALLKPDGVMLLHAIGRSEPPGDANPWIRKYIFPGGYIPALSEVLAAIEPTDLYVTDIEILHTHYAETLKAWRERFRARWREAAELYDERFCRMWDFYLAGSEATFRAGGFMVFQIQLTKNLASVPMTRDYIAAEEAAMNRNRRSSESLRMAGE
jgi:cyclopropane-fatty-acyl-phospholipid synthase